MINHARSLLIGKSQYHMYNNGKQGTLSVTSTNIFSNNGIVSALNNVNLNGLLNIQDFENHTPDYIDLHGSELNFDQNVVLKTMEGGAYTEIKNGLLTFSIGDDNDVLSYTPLDQDIIDKSEDITKLWNILFEDSTDTYFLSYRAFQLLSFLQSTDLAHIITDYDSRITYDFFTMFSNGALSTVTFDKNYIQWIGSLTDIENRYDIVYLVTCDSTENKVTLFDAHISNTFTFDLPPLFREDQFYSTPVTLPNDLGSIYIKHTDFCNETLRLRNRPQINPSQLLELCDKIISGYSWEYTDSVIKEILDYYNNNLSVIKKLSAVVALIIVYRNNYNG